jgi:hypothetical protein
MKHSMKLHLLQKEGHHILRPMRRRGGNRFFWVVAAYIYGWSNYTETRHYDTQAEAFSAIEKFCANNPLCIDERNIEKP